jgi:hypothetical protein
MLEVVAHAAALALLIGAFLLPGIAIERAGWAAVDLSGLRALARAVLGIAATSLALFALALAGALRPLAFAVLALVCAALALRSLRRRGGPASSEPIELRFAAALALATAPFWVGALDYRIAWDAAAYHLALPKRYLEAGGFTQVPISVYAVWPHAIQLLYAPALWLRDSPLASALHTAFGVLALWAAQLGARASGFRRAGWFAAPLALANPVLLFELGEAYVDLALAFFFCAGAIFAARALRSRVPDPGALALAGVCGGACAAAKINGVLLALALALALVPRAIALLRARETRALARSALCYAIPVAASWLPWLARSAWLTGDPFYPLLYAQLGGPDWSAELAQRFAAWQQQTGFGRGLSDYLLLPLRVLVAGGPEYQRFGGRLGAHWLVCIPLAVALARRDPLARFTLAASGCYFALWALGSQQTRFLIPMLPALALATGIALERGIALARARWPALRERKLVAGAAALSLAPLALFGGEHFGGAIASLGALRSDAAARRAAQVEAPIAFANASLPRDARMLLLDTNLVFFLEREAIADSFFEASQIADWLSRASTAPELAALFAERGITHLLWDRRRDWGIVWPRALRELLADPARARRLYGSADGRVELFELVSGLD